MRIVKNYHPFHPDTLIVERPAAERLLLPAIISTAGLNLVAVGSQDDSWTVPMAARALKQLPDAGVGVLMFSQSFS